MKLKASVFLISFLATPLTFASTVKDNCAQKWPSDFSMQEFCIQKQANAAHGIEAWLGKHNLTLDNYTSPQNRAFAPAQIFDKCNTKWWPDLKMTMFCVEKDEAAAVRLGKIGGAPADSLSFQSGLKGHIAALGVVTEFQKRHEINIHLDQVRQKAKEGLPAAKLYVECEPANGGMEKYREMARCVLNRESELAN